MTLNSESESDIQRENIFHISYPKSKPGILDESSKDPVIFLFGWLGAKDEYLQVYSRIYEEQGYPVVRLTVPLLILLRHNETIKNSEKMLKLLKEPALADRPIIFHCFSNGGTFQYEVFVESMNESERKLVKGAIFDSGPAKKSINNVILLCKTLIGAVIKNKILLYLSTAVIVPFLIFGEAIKKVQGVLLKQPTATFDPYTNLMNQRDIWPQLFIYSKVDHLVPYKALETFIEQRKARGVEVMTKIYENTQHVKHYPFDKLGYRNLVLKFINKALKK